MSYVGQSISRHEDRRLLRGFGRFVDDVELPGQLWMRVVRAPVAHAYIRGVDDARARSSPAVKFVLTGEQLASIPPIPMRLKPSGLALDGALQPVLARGRVRYVGEPVAVVVAEDAQSAEDAAELVTVEYEPLPCVVDARAGADGHELRDDMPNRVATFQTERGEADKAFAGAAHVVELRLHIGRHTAVPLETRGIVARYDPSRGHVEVWGQTKVAHYNRRLLASLLGISIDAIHFKTSDVGGGFGVRGEFYPEDLLVPFLARELGRPVKWIEDRAEHLVATNHSRQQEHEIALALDEDGRILGMRDEIWHDNGAYLRTHGVAVPQITLTMLPGPYRIENYSLTIHVVTTNKTPAGTYRGPGRYEGTFAREQAINVAAARLGIDRSAIRRRNLLRRDELPHRRSGLGPGTQTTLRESDYLGLMDKALERSGFASWEAEASRLRSQGRLVGTGLCYFLEKSGLGPYETAGVKLDLSGTVRVLTGGASLGQGLETVLAQVAADELGVNPEDVEVVHGDTDLIPDGVGSWASRSTVVGGSAVLEAARDVADQIRRVGAEILGVNPEKVVLSGGQVSVRRTEGRDVSLADVAASAADPMRPGGDCEPDGIRAQRRWFADEMNFPYGLHLAQIEVDPVTYGVTVLRYFVAYEVGRAINPQLVEGQLVGGVAQGLGGALLEEFTYDDHGQPQATTFMDYLLPTAAEMPIVGTLILEDAPPQDNPLGVMGAGEGGTTGCGAAIANALDDALSQSGLIDRLPATPTRLHAWHNNDAGDARDHTA